MTLTVGIADLEEAQAIAQMVVPYGIYIEDYSNLEQEAKEIAHIDLIDEALLQKDRSQAIIHIYISPEEAPAEALAFLEERCRAAKIKAQIARASIKEADWANEWKQFFKPIEIGRRLAICPTWETYENTENRSVLMIDPGMAFGTGGHATTRLCLETLEQFITEDTTLLDLGCGSGVLSIAALLLGAKSAVGVDIDALAVKTAIENGRINGFEPPRYQIRQGNLAQQVSGRFDVVAANIVADVIIGFCPEVKRYMNPDAVFVTSGIVDIREKEVLEAFAANDLHVTERRESNGWLSFVCKA